MSTGRLLIVDDERTYAQFLAIVAAKADYAVHTVDDVSAFEFHVDYWRPTVVFLDIIMPERDGLELIGSLERGKYGGHLVLMSGSDARFIDMTAASARARGLRVAAILRKPCPMQRVEALLRELADEP